MQKDKQRFIKHVHKTKDRGVCAFVLFLLNIVWLVDFRLMINSVVSSNMFSYEYLLQCFAIYFAILFIYNPEEWADIFKASGAK
jgi:hypothetical protein